MSIPRNKTRTNTYSYSPDSNENPCPLKRYFSLKNKATVRSSFFYLEKPFSKGKIAMKSWN
tara:strand:- start:38600 stop:38782 length:183 start_codon:yes stop_codon:yes gene_type:complete